MLLVYRSIGSYPAIDPMVRAQSETVLDIGPIVSIDQQAPSTPYLLTLPHVGRRPTRPQLAAGPRIDPPVSSPNEVAHKNPEVAAPEPVLEVPGFLSMSQGFLAGP